MDVVVIEDGAIGEEDVWRERTRRHLIKYSELKINKK